jgi:hypothetical protein
MIISMINSTMKKRRFSTSFFSLLSSLLLVAVLLAACQPKATAPTPDNNAIMTEAVASAMAQLATPTFTVTPEPTATAVRTPPALPALFQTNLLDAINTPHTYITDSCQQLKDKWTSTNAAPGTVVMVVMFHSISKDAATEVNQISAGDQKKLMNDLHDMGFQAINMQQMADFMEHNTKVPPRSVLMIVDDRHFAEYFNDHFRPFYEKWGWPVVNAYIAKDERPDLWAQNAALSAEGWVDYQAHGVIHNTPITSSSSEEYMLSELQGAIANIQKYMNKTPIAYIWPGGGFTPRAAQLARQVGYQLGFTVNPRGPVMYNWVPLADSDPNPYAIADGPVNDPLMVLPRYWDTDARAHLDTVTQIGDAATAYAQQNKATELEYYDIVCAPKLGPMP